MGLILAEHGLEMDWLIYQYKQNVFLRSFFPFYERLEHGDLVAHSRLDSSFFVIKRTSEKCFRCILVVVGGATYITARNVKSLLEQLENIIKRKYKEFNKIYEFW